MLGSVWISCQKMAWINSARQLSITVKARGQRATCWQSPTAELTLVNVLQLIQSPESVNIFPLQHQENASLVSRNSGQRDCRLRVCQPRSPQMLLPSRETAPQDATNDPCRQVRLPPTKVVPSAIDASLPSQTASSQPPLPRCRRRPLPSIGEGRLLDGALLSNRPRRDGVNIRGRHDAKKIPSGKAQSSRGKGLDVLEQQYILAL